MSEEEYLFEFGNVATEIAPEITSRFSEFGIILPVSGFLYFLIRPCVPNCFQLIKTSLSIIMQDGRVRNRRSLRTCRSRKVLIEN